MWLHIPGRLLCNMGDMFLLFALRLLHWKRKRCPQLSIAVKSFHRVHSDRTSFIHANAANSRVCNWFNIRDVKTSNRAGRSVCSLSNVQLDVRTCALEQLGVQHRRRMWKHHPLFVTICLPLRHAPAGRGSGRKAVSGRLSASAGLRRCGFDLSAIVSRLFIPLPAERTD